MSFENLSFTLPETLDAENINFIDCKGPDERRARRVTFECEVLSEGITETEFGQSIYCKVSDPILLCIEALQDSFKELVPEDYELTECVKSDAFFLKLPLVKGKYKAVIIPASDPAFPEKSPIVYGSTLEVSVSFHGYLNPIEKIGANPQPKKAGMYMTVHRIVVDGGKKRRITLKK
jgi:hypothetical protein